MRNVRILLVGDDGVGKTTLISTLLREEFVEEVEPILNDVTVSPQATTEKVTTQIVDSSSALEHRERLQQEIQFANVICVVYSADNPESFQSVTQFWLPFIRNRGVDVPIILVGTKIDTREENSTFNFEEEVLPIMKDWKEVETCLECSAKSYLNVAEVFYFAQRAVLHPTAPLYDAREHTLKQKCEEAIRRIFKICDKDRDGILSDTELNQFQEYCFGSPLSADEIQHVKRIVSEGEPNGVENEGINEQGFLYLNRFFIQRGRMETTWTLVRRFGYGDDLELTDEFLNPEVSVAPDQSVELSARGVQFFTELFRACDKDEDGALSPHELDQLFITAPGTPWPGMDFASTTITTPKTGWITLKGFLALWSMTTLLDFHVTLRYLAYLGFPSPSLQGVQLTRTRRKERETNQVTRNVLNCFLFGSSTSGKTSILRRHIRQKFAEESTPLGTQRVINTVEMGGSEKYLVIQEFDSPDDAAVLSDSNKLLKCDVICFAYDSSNTTSFAYVANLVLRFQHNLGNVPLLFVASKSDRDRVPQKYEVPPEEFCRKLGIPKPVSISIKNDIFVDSLFSMLVTMSLQPNKFLPLLSQKKKSLQLIRRVGIASLSLGLVGLTVFSLYRYFRYGRIFNIEDVDTTVPVTSTTSRFLTNSTTNSTPPHH